MLKAAVLRLYSNGQLRRLLAYNAKKKVLQYDEDIVFGKILEIYENVTRDSNRGGRRQAGTRVLRSLANRWIRD
jgi:hypothetical protein